jgi:hypothetical protein
MGKPPLSPKPAADRRMRLMGILAIIAALLLALAIGIMIYKAMARPGAPLPAGAATGVPIPSALPDVKQKDLPQAALPEAKVPEVPQAPVPKVEAPPVEKAPEPSGTVTWRWQLYPITPTAFGQAIQPILPGFTTVALGLTVYNNSTVNIEVGNERDEFTVNADNRIYKADVWQSAASIFFNGLPYLQQTTLAPGGRADGFTVFAVPANARKITVDWRHSVPSTVKVVRVDPQTPIVQPQQAAPAPRRANDEE